ncbi:hypothetical protein [Microvirga sp. VF16]|uniref:hypothetical protein n=1 Tax=Microvirga sp. VF16 TaxID=2807101 RepID=UPI00193D5228|nr:hypothetical protein [Microvirga sp. VF16]QRM32970.1 hypothetical protein JO965_26955 [Microvirga sp. VF16]
MKRSVEPTPKWSLRSSAIYGGLAGLAVAAFHQVHHVVFNNIPDDIYTHVIGEMVASVVGGAILFTGVAAFRNWLKTPGSG